MNVFRTVRTIETVRKKQLVDITEDINLFVKETGIKNGSLIVQTLHTTMGLIIQELSEPRLCSDILTHLDGMFSDRVEDYRHNDLDKRPEVVDKENEPLNGKSHIQCSILPSQLSLDIWDGKLTLGKWQRVGLLELDGPRDNRSYLIKAWRDPAHFRIFGKDFVELNLPDRKEEEEIKTNGFSYPDTLLKI